MRSSLSSPKPKPRRKLLCQCPLRGYISPVPDLAFFCSCFNSALEAFLNERRSQALDKEKENNDGEN